MPYFTCIGPHGVNRYNVGKFGQRGYWMYRRGTDVIVVWGPVKPVKGRTVTVIWTQTPRRKTFRHHNAISAQLRLKRLIRERIRPHKGYSTLPRGVKIQ